MHEIEPPVVSEKREQLLGSIRVIHERHGLKFPVDEPGPFAFDHLDELWRRAASMPAVRTDSYHAIASVYGEDSPEARAAYIVSEIGTDLDHIFLSQLAAKGKDFGSWRRYDRKHADHLALVIDVLIQDSTLDSHATSMLAILKTLATTDAKDQFETNTMELQRLAVLQYNARKPVLFFRFSDWYLDPNRNPELDIEVLEPDCRLILPYERKAYDSVVALVQNAALDLVHFYPESEGTQMQVGIVGDAMMWAGSQLVSYTVGEALDVDGFVFSPNILKSVHRVTDIFQRAGLPVPSDLVSKLTQQYIYHELGHSYFLPTSRYIDDIATDVTAVVCTVSENIDKNDEVLTNAIALLLGEYIQYVGIEPTGEANSDGYRISSIFIVEKLLDYHLVKVLPDGRLHIHQDRENCKRLIGELLDFHKLLVAGDEITIERLKQISPSEAALQVARMV